MMNIIVTGASQGIGSELVKILSRDPLNRVMAISRNLDSLKNLQNLCRKQSGNEIIILGKDLNSNDFLQDVEKEVANSMPVLDILVNNAGQLVHKAFTDLDENDFDTMFSVNVKAPFLLARMLLPYFNNPAHIVNIGSMGGFQGSVKFPGLSLYSASKGALAILTECMAEELKEANISVNCLALGSAQTEMLERAFPGFRSPTTAEDMAQYVAEFALKGKDYFNGKIIPVAVTTP